MSDKENRQVAADRYRAMTTQELEHLVRMDMEGPAGADTEDILCILEELKNRQKAESTKKTGNTAQKAWESFQRDYLPENEEPVQRKTTSWLRRLTTVAAVLLLVVGLIATVDAFSGGNLWSVVENWSKDTFHFAPEGVHLTEPTPYDTREFESFHQAIVELTDNTALVPTRIPEGFKLKDIVIDENPGRTVFLALYCRGDEEFTIHVQPYFGTDVEWVEKNEGSYDLYEGDGITCYIFSNYEQYTGAWLKDSYECYISGELSVEEIKAMINSIGKG